MKAEGGAALLTWRADVDAGPRLSALEHLCYPWQRPKQRWTDIVAAVEGISRVSRLSDEARVALLAYAAGVLDSDGSISILRDTHAVRHGRATQPTFSERVTIRQIEPEAVDLLHEFFGGCRSVISGRRANQQPLQSLQLVDRQAARLLTAVRPYLRIKLGQADLCLQLRELKEESRRARFAYGRGHRGAGKRPEGLSDAMEQVRVRIAELNRIAGRAVRRSEPN